MQKEGDGQDLLPRLIKEQEKNGWISEQALKDIAVEINIPITRVYAVATFYTYIYTKPQGKYIIELCNSPACFLNGAMDLIEFLNKELKIKPGQTTKDKKFSLHIVSCIGCCNTPPALMINKKVYTSLTPKKLRRILKRCK